MEVGAAITGTGIFKGCWSEVSLVWGYDGVAPNRCYQRLGLRGGTLEGCCVVGTGVIVTSQNDQKVVKKHQFNAFSIQNHIKIKAKVVSNILLVNK